MISSRQALEILEARRSDFCTNHEFPITGIAEELGVSTHDHLMYLPSRLFTFNSEIRVFASYMEAGEAAHQSSRKAILSNLRYFRRDIGRIIKELGVEERDGKNMTFGRNSHLI